MMPSELSSMIWKIRRDGFLRSLLGLFVLFLLLTETESASRLIILVIVAAYLIVVSTWASVTAGRILRDFCVNSAAEVERLKAELEEIRTIIDGAIEGSQR